MRWNETCQGHNRWAVASEPGHCRRTAEMSHSARFAADTLKSTANTLPIGTGRGTRETNSHGERPTGVIGDLHGREPPWRASIGYR